MGRAVDLARRTARRFYPTTGTGADMSEIATWSLQRRLEETLRKALPKLGPEVRGQIEAMINPQALAIVAAVLIAWVVSHAFGLGQIIDILIVGVGAFSIGMA